MKSTRRGFLSLLGGGAVAGPGALKKAMASAASTGSFGAVPSSIGSGIASQKLNNGCWKAQEILEIMRYRNRPATHSTGEEQFTDIQALKSVSPTAKAIMTRNRRADADLSRLLREFIKEHKLNWVGLTEERLLSIVKQAAGE